MAYPNFTPLSNQLLDSLQLARPRFQANGTSKTWGFHNGFVLRSERSAKPTGLTYKMGTLLQHTLPVRPWQELPTLYELKSNNGMFSGQTAVGHDVPLELLQSLTVECFKTEQLYRKHDPVLGNQIELLPNTTTLAYSSGARFSYIDFLRFKPTADNTEEALLSVQPLTTRGYFLTPIQQVIAPLWEGSIGLGVRTLGGVSLPFDFIPTFIEGEEEGEVNKLFPSERSLPDTPFDLTFHSAFQCSAALTANNSLFVWQGGNDVPEHIDLGFSYEEKEHYPLGCLRFGYHPRTFVSGTTGVLSLVDSRSRTLRTTNLQAASCARFNGFDTSLGFSLEVSTSNQFLSYDLRYFKHPTHSWPFSYESYKPHVMPGYIDENYCSIAWGPTTGAHIYPKSSDCTPFTGLTGFPVQLSHPDDYLLPGQISVLAPPRHYKDIAKGPIVGLKLLNTVRNSSDIQDPERPNSSLQLIQMSESGCIYSQSLKSSLAPELEQVAFRSLCSNHSELGSSDQFDADPQSRKKSSKIQNLLAASSDYNSKSEYLKSDPSSQLVESNRTTSDSSCTLWKIDSLPPLPPFEDSNETSWRQVYEKILGNIKNNDYSEESNLDIDSKILQKDLKLTTTNFIPNLPEFKVGSTADPILDWWDDPDLDDSQLDHNVNSMPVKDTDGKPTALSAKDNNLGIPTLNQVDQTFTSFSQPNRIPPISYSQPPSQRVLRSATQSIPNFPPQVGSSKLPIQPTLNLRPLSSTQPSLSQPQKLSQASQFQKRPSSQSTRSRRAPGFF